MFLNMDQLEKQLDKEEFQENGAMAVFKVLKTQFQTSIAKRALHKREYDSRVNERQMPTTKEKVDMSKALDARQQHTEQPELNNEGEVDQNAEQCHDTRPLLVKLTDNKIHELSN
ncbi:hypothetical protein Tco_0122395 [Tanacetum coccineum]